MTRTDIFTPVHDQIESRGLWYNSAVLEKAGVSTDKIFADWTSFGDAMDKINTLGNVYTVILQARDPVRL